MYFWRQPQGQKCRKDARKPVFKKIPRQGALVRTEPSVQTQRGVPYASVIPAGNPDNGPISVETHPDSRHFHNQLRRSPAGPAAILRSPVGKTDKNLPQHTPGNLAQKRNPNEKLILSIRLSMRIGCTSGSAEAFSKKAVSVRPNPNS